MIAYCRGCNREFEVHEEQQSNYIELIGSIRYQHPKVDVDIRES